MATELKVEWRKLNAALGKRNSGPSPLIAYQNSPSNPLYPQLFSFVVPTWCQV